MLPRQLAMVGDDADCRGARVIPYDRVRRTQRSRKPLAYLHGYRLAIRWLAIVDPDAEIRAGLQRVPVHDGQFARWARYVKPRVKTGDGEVLPWT